VLTVADKITFFIKEISVIPNWLQARISGLIESGSHSFDSRDGSNKNNVDIRIVASTTRNLYGLVKKGLFREDLFYRLNVLKVRVPPLRDRIADIPALSDFFYSKHCCEFDKNCYQISATALSRMCEYNWPGNLNELEKIVERIILSGQEEHVVQNLAETMVQSNPQPIAPPNNIIDNGSGLADIKAFLKDTRSYSLKSLRQEFTTAVEKNLVNKALVFTSGNRKKAAAALEISYKSFLNKMKAFRNEKE
jgi:DNA-binding NtrC family response regulator